eukprot:3179809-Rhodomonas_salina.1
MAVLCGTAIDAVWTAAIAISRVGVAEDGSVDKALLLTAIRNVSFEGASGWVEFDEKGERESASMSLILKNMRPVTGTDGAVTIATLPTFRWQSTEDGQGSLVRESNDPPLWPGGERAWQFPHEVMDCETGFVFSTSSLQCELCPAGTVVGGNECVRFDANLGVLVPLRWGEKDSPLEPWAVRYAASAVMAEHHINNRVASL